jgi:hypothetical protein
MDYHVSENSEPNEVPVETHLEVVSHLVFAEVSVSVKGLTLDLAELSRPASAGEFQEDFMPSPVEEIPVSVRDFRKHCLHRCY